MGQKQITEDNKEIMTSWFEEAKKQTLDTLPEFMNNILNGYSHDYGTIVRAISACAIAAANAANHSEQGGITGFQAGFVMWDFIRHWSYENNKCGLGIIDYDKMLYPQYGYIFDKTISPQIMENLVNEAKQILADSERTLHPEVRAHMEMIAAGVPPFGYKVKED